VEKSPLPKLYHKDSKGNLRTWQVSVQTYNSKNRLSKIITESGIKGKKSSKWEKEIHPKNVGRKNETSSEEQAWLEARSLYKQKMDKKYSTSILAAGEVKYNVMLAHDYSKHKKKLDNQFPVYIQPKLDGVRALAMWDSNRKKVILKSRGNQLWNLPHISDPLEEWLPYNVILDGEVYKHGLNFQEISRLVKKERPETSYLSLFVYDMIDEFDPNKTYADRKIRVDELLDTDRDGLCLCPTHICINHNEIVRMTGHFVELGYEGSIVRSPEGIYKLGYRSYDLLKFKHFQDEEYKIIGHKSAKTFYQGDPFEYVIWVCEIPGGRTFDVVPKGTFEQRKEWLDNASSYYGQQLKVKFFRKSEDNVPIFPVGLGIRLKEEA
jgi:ATP-dependent DNA ligase